MAVQGRFQKWKELDDTVAVNVKYSCSICKRERTREDLVVKRVQFKEMGVSGKVIRTRAVGWLCRDACLLDDQAWVQQEYTQAPGTLAKRSPVLESDGF